MRFSNREERRRAGEWKLPTLQYANHLSMRESDFHKLDVSVSRTRSLCIRGPQERAFVSEVMLALLSSRVTMTHISPTFGMNTVARGPAHETLCIAGTAS